MWELLVKLNEKFNCLFVFINCVWFCVFCCLLMLYFFIMCLWRFCFFFGILGFSLKGWNLIFILMLLRVLMVFCKCWYLIIYYGYIMLEIILIVIFCILFVFCIFCLFVVMIGFVLLNLWRYKGLDKVIKRNFNFILWLFCCSYISFCCDFCCCVYCGVVKCGKFFKGWVCLYFIVFCGGMKVIFCY